MYLQVAALSPKFVFLFSGINPETQLRDPISLAINIREHIRLGNEMIKKNVDNTRYLRNASKRLHVSAPMMCKLFKTIRNDYRQLRVIKVEFFFFFLND